MLIRQNALRFQHPLGELDMSHPYFSPRAGKCEPARSAVAAPNAQCACSACRVAQSIPVPICIQPVVDARRTSRIWLLELVMCQSHSSLCVEASHLIGVGTPPLHFVLHSTCRHETGRGKRRSGAPREIFICTTQQMDSTQYFTPHVRGPEV